MILLVISFAILASFFFALTEYLELQDKQHPDKKTNSRWHKTQFLSYLFVGLLCYCFALYNLSSTTLDIIFLAFAFGFGIWASNDEFINLFLKRDLGSIAYQSGDPLKHFPLWFKLSGIVICLVLKWTL